jgi:hypothetical protein
VRRASPPAIPWWRAADELEFRVLGEEQDRIAIRVPDPPRGSPRLVAERRYLKARRAVDRVLSAVMSRDRLDVTIRDDDSATLARATSRDAVPVVAEYVDLRDHDGDPLGRLESHGGGIPTFTLRHPEKRVALTVLPKAVEWRRLVRRGGRTLAAYQGVHWDRTGFRPPRQPAYRLTIEPEVPRDGPFRLQLLLVVATAHWLGREYDAQTGWRGGPDC